jgi:NAD-dependent deacetylase
MSDFDETLRAVRRWIDEAECVVVLTGAGISTDSGIPDFRGPKGVWTKNPEAEKMATIQHYMAEPEIRRRSWQQKLAMAGAAREPNAGHRALVALHKRGKLDTLITQNVDGLHQDAGIPPEIVVEIHGTLREFICMKCGDGGPMELALERVRAGEEDPACQRCGGILKSATISFGQGLVAEDLERAERARHRHHALGLSDRRRGPRGQAHRRARRDPERRAHRHGRAGRRGAAGRHQRDPASHGDACRLSGSPLTLMIHR